MGPSDVQLPMLAAAPSSNSFSAPSGSSQASIQTTVGPNQSLRGASSSSDSGANRNKDNRAQNVHGWSGFVKDNRVCSTGSCTTVLEAGWPWKRCPSCQGAAKRARSVNVPCSSCHVFNVAVPPGLIQSGGPHLCVPCRERRLALADTLTLPPSQSPLHTRPSMPVAESAASPQNRRASTGAIAGPRALQLHHALPVPQPLPHVVSSFSPGQTSFLDAAAQFVHPHHRHLLERRDLAALPAPLGLPRMTAFAPAPTYARSDGLGMPHYGPRGEILAVLPGDLDARRTPPPPLPAPMAPMQDPAGVAMSPNVLSLDRRALHAENPLNTTTASGARAGPSFVRSEPPVQPMPLSQVSESPHQGGALDTPDDSSQTPGNKQDRIPSASPAPVRSPPPRKKRKRGSAPAALGERICASAKCGRAIAPGFHGVLCVECGFARWRAEFRERFVGLSKEVDAAAAGGVKTKDKDKGAEAQGSDASPGQSGAELRTQTKATTTKTDDARTVAPAPAEPTELTSQTETSCGRLFPDESNDEPVRLLVSPSAADSTSAPEKSPSAAADTERNNGIPPPKRHSIKSTALSITIPPLPRRVAVKGAPSHPDAQPKAGLAQSPDVRRIDVDAAAHKAAYASLYSDTETLTPISELDSLSPRLPPPTRAASSRLPLLIPRLAPAPAPPSAFSSIRRVRLILGPKPPTPPPVTSSSEAEHGSESDASEHRSSARSSSRLSSPESSLTSRESRSSSPEISLSSLRSPSGARAPSVSHSRSWSTGERWATVAAAEVAEWDSDESELTPLEDSVDEGESEVEPKDSEPESSDDGEPLAMALAKAVGAGSVGLHGVRARAKHAKGMKGRKSEKEGSVDGEELERHRGQCITGRCANLLARGWRYRSCNVCRTRARRLRRRQQRALQQQHVPDGKRARPDVVDYGPFRSENPRGSSQHTSTTDPALAGGRQPATTTIATETTEPGDDDAIIRWKAGSDKLAAMPPYQHLAALLHAFCARFAEFQTAQARYVQLKTLQQGALPPGGRTTPMVFSFGGEYSIVADPSSGSVDAVVNGVVRNVQAALGLAFKPVGIQTGPEDSVAALLRCYCSAQIPVPTAEQPAGVDADGSLGEGSLVDVKMVGELQICVAWDRRHKFFPGQRIIVSFRLVG